MGIDMSRPCPLGHPLGVNRQTAPQAFNCGFCNEERSQGEEISACPTCVRFWVCSQCRASRRPEDDPDQVRRFMKAADEGDLDQLKRELSLIPSAARFVDHSGATAMTRAAAMQQWPAVCLLVTLGADVHRMDRFGQNVLFKLFSEEWTEQQEEAAQFLLARGGAELVNAENNGAVSMSLDFTALGAAATRHNYRAMQLLLDSGLADVNRTSFRGNTAIYYAAQNGHYEAALMLLNGGGKTSVADAAEAKMLKTDKSAWLREWTLCKLP